MQVTIVVPDTTPEQRRLPMERMGARVLVQLPDSTPQLPDSISQLPDSTSHVARVAPPGEVASPSAELASVRGAGGGG